MALDRALYRAFMIIRLRNLNAVRYTRLELSSLTFVVTVVGALI